MRDKEMQKGEIKKMIDHGHIINSEIDERKK